MKRKLRILLLALLVIWSLSVPALATELGGPVYIAGSTYYNAANKAFVYYVDNTAGQAIYSSVADGMITAQGVSVKADAGVAFEVYLDGERLESISGGTFQEPGEYVVMYMGGAVSEQLFSFTIVPEFCNYVTGYTMPVGFEILEATLNGETAEFDKGYIKLTDEGKYNIRYRCNKTNMTYQLAVKTDFTGPVLSLTEVENGAARGPVDISEAGQAAAVNIYHDGEKIAYKDVLTESGEYYIELADKAGNKTTYSFTILIYFDSNSWIFFLMVLSACVGLLAYLMHARKHLRVR